MPFHPNTSKTIITSSVIFLIFVGSQLISVFLWADNQNSQYHRITPPFLNLPRARPAVGQRKFQSDIIEDVIRNVSKILQDANDPDLAVMFENCFPNTLDTTVLWHDSNMTHPRSFIITGDIPAMWIRDSTNQLLPYVPFMTSDQRLRQLIWGAIRMQAEFLSYDPYANAFKPPLDYPGPIEDNPLDQDDVIPSYDHRIVWESKYELDSLAAFLKFSYAFFKEGYGDLLVVDPVWQAAVLNVIETVHTQSRPTWSEPNPSSDDWGIPSYRFTRPSRRPSESQENDGLGNPVAEGCGLVRSAFRPSDDATIFPFLIPANAMMSVELAHLATMLRETRSTPLDLRLLAPEASHLSERIRNGIFEHAIVQHPVHGPIFAFEIDCYGSHLLMDDANIPSLLSLPYLGFVSSSEPTYINTRNFVLSLSNPWYFEGFEGRGIGGPHVGKGMVWPMSELVAMLTMDYSGKKSRFWKQGLKDINVMKSVSSGLERIKKTSAGTGFIHESYNIDNSMIYTRPWFAWANTLFGETVLDILEKAPVLFQKPHNREKSF